MAKELVVSDASTLIGLAAAEAFELLRGLFGQVVVSTTVRDEVFAGGDRQGLDGILPSRVAAQPHGQESPSRRNWTRPGTVAYTRLPSEAGTGWPSRSRASLSVLSGQKRIARPLSPPRT